MQYGYEKEKMAYTRHTYRHLPCGGRRVVLPSWRGRFVEQILGGGQTSAPFVNDYIAVEAFRGVRRRRKATPLVFGWNGSICL